MSLNAQIITTISGGARSGYSGDGGLAISAQINNPMSVVINKTGDIYFADFANSALRKIDSKTGIISTVLQIGVACIGIDNNDFIYIASWEANTIYKYDPINNTKVLFAGTGINGWSGDGGDATLAQISNVAGMAFDKDNNMYFTERDVLGDGNRDVRRIDSKTHIITTYAGTGDARNFGDGGLAINASFIDPNGIAINSKGDIFISDIGHGDLNGYIRKIDAKSGIITLYCNAVTPTGMEFDSKDNLFVSGYVNNRIYKVDPDVHNLSIIAGIPDKGYNGDNIDATTAELNSPNDIALDKNGNIIIADTYNNRIRMISNITPDLPVHMSSFKAISTQYGHQIIWTTGVESNTKNFNVQVSTNGKDFKDITSVQSKGSNSSYQYLDENKYNESTLYYRLAIHDNDGTIAYSDIYTLKVAASSDLLSVSPNPATSKIKVQNALGFINVYDAAGRLVITKENTGSVTEIRIESLSAGIYYIKDGSGTKTKFIKK